MKNPELWKPTKYEYTEKNVLRGSRNKRELSSSSRLIADRVAEFYTRAIPEYSKGAILDLGCGKAPLYGLYRNFCETSTCVDWELSLHENPLLDAHADLNEPLPFADGSFDTVLLSDVLEHVWEPLRVMSEISRILRSDGVLIMNVPFCYWLHEIPFDYHRFTSYALLRMCAVENLEVRELNSIGGVPEILSDIVAKSVAKLPGLGDALAALMQWSVGRFTRTRCGRSLSERSGEKFPLGYALVAYKLPPE